MPGMWPDFTKTGQFFSAHHLQNEIIMTCQAKLADPSLPTGSLSRIMWDLILAHAQLDRVNQAHGLLRDFVKVDGTGVSQSKINTAWGHVLNAHAFCMLPMPTLGQLTQALDGIDHGGGGGLLPGP